MAVFGVSGFRRPQARSPHPRHQPPQLRQQKAELNAGGQAIFALGDSLPPVSSLLHNMALASTLTSIAAGGARAFYKGPITESIARFVEAEGGYLRASDLSAYRVCSQTLA